MSDIAGYMYDAAGDKYSNIPNYVEAVLWYVDGRESEWPKGALDRFPSAKKAAITVLGDYQAARVADIENGDMTFADAPGFVHNRNKFAGTKDATLYCSLSNVPDVVEQADKAGEPYWLFVADYTGKPRGGYSLDTGNGTICAQQYTGGPGMPYDISAVYSREWWDMLPGGLEAKAPAPAAKTASLAELDGYVVYTNSLKGFSGRAVKSLDNGKSWQ